MKNIGVVIGGRSVEHEVAVITALQMIENLDKNKYNVYPILIENDGKMYVGEGLSDFKNYKNKSFENLKEVFVKPSFGDKKLYTLEQKEIGGGLFSKKEFVEVLEPYCELDCVLLGVHGTNGEDGTLQGFFETIGIPYTGGDVISSSVGMDKVLMKDVYKQYNIPVVKYEWFYRSNWEKDREEVLKNLENLKYPLIVKPSNLGSSIGISKAKNKDELIYSIEVAKNYDRKIIVEEAVENLREINVAVLGYEDDLKVSVLEEPIGWKDIQTFDNKYSKLDSVGRRIPAEVSEDVKSEIERLAKVAFRCINCSGTARIDFMLENDTKIYVNEINTLPGSTAYYLWEAVGIKFSELLDELIEIAIKKQNDKNKNMVRFESDLYNKTSYGTKAFSLKQTK